MAQLDQNWYEQAADIVSNSYVPPDERLAILNKLWDEYRFEIDRLSVGIRINLSNEQFMAAMDQALRSTTGLSLQQIVNSTKEMIRNGCTAGADNKKADTADLGAG